MKRATLLILLLAINVNALVKLANLTTQQQYEFCCYSYNFSKCATTLEGFNFTATDYYCELRFVEKSRQEVASINFVNKLVTLLGEEVTLLVFIASIVLLVALFYKVLLNLLK